MGACPNLAKMLNEIGLTTFKNKGFELELIFGSSMVMPPTETKCKMTERMNACKFNDLENLILKLKKNSQQYSKIIHEYIKNYCDKKHSGLSAGDKKRLNKQQKEI